jgi:hypothetical protein
VTKISDFLDTVEREIGGAPGAARLRGIRGMLDDPAFVEGVLDELGGIDNPVPRNVRTVQLWRLRRAFEDNRQKRGFEKDLTMQIGLTGGVTMIVGSIVAAAAVAILPFVVPIVGGACMAFQGVIGASRLDEETHLYGQLAGQTAEILKQVP